jgi:hypothetical protein
MVVRGGGGAGLPTGEPEEELDEEPVELDGDSGVDGGSGVGVVVDGGRGVEAFAVSPRARTTAIASLFPGGMMRAKS